MLGNINLATLAVLAVGSYAQTYTTCNPLSATCPSNPALSDNSFSTDFTTAKSIPSGWSMTNAGAVTYDGNGANIMVTKQGDSPTLLTDFYILFGSLEAKVKAAPGQGIVSSIVLLSDDLDEVDWEFTGTNTAQVQTNYFGKGDDSSFDRGGYSGVGSPQTTVHTYRLDWTPQSVIWSIDGTQVRVLNFNDAAGGTRFPQTPMRVRLGIWAGGDPTNAPGTIEWAGGPTDFSKAPFAMQVQSVNIVNYSPGKSYTYKDNSGTYQSIGIDSGSLMSNGAGAQSPSGSTKTSSTSQSQGPPVPTLNPITGANGTTAANSTISKTATLSATSTKTGSSTQQTNAAAGLESIGAVTTVVMASLGFAMALFI